MDDARWRRERSARKEAERLLEEKSRELWSANERLRHLAAGLEERVAERTRALEMLSARLQRAKEEAEAADVGKTRLLAAVSHELRTPVHVILGLAELLAEPTLSPGERRTYRSTIRSNGEALTRLLSDLLDLSRVDTGRLSLALLPCRVDGLVRELAESARRRAVEKGLTFETQVAGLDTPIRMDVVRLRQILTNLLDNAVKFTAHGGIRFEVRMVPEGGGLRLRARVEDTGIGFGGASAALFEPFGRLDNAVSAGIPGTGVGLALSRRLARTLGGDLTTEDPAAPGARLALELPVERSEEVLHASPVTVERQAAPGATVLVVDDQPENRSLMKVILEKAQYRVVVADGVPAAMEQVERSAPRAVVLDGGLAALADALAARGFSGAIVILDAGLPTPEKRRLAALGATLLPMPVRRAALIEVLHASLSGG